MRCYLTFHSYLHSILPYIPFSLTFHSYLHSILSRYYNAVTAVCCGGGSTDGEQRLSITQNYKNLAMGWPAVTTDEMADAASPWHQWQWWPGPWKACVAPAPPHIVPRHTSHSAQHTSHATQCTSHATRHTVHVTHHTPHATQCTSHVTRHIVHVTAHATRHTSHSLRSTVQGTLYIVHVTFGVKWRVNVSPCGPVTLLVADSWVCCVYSFTHAPHPPQHLQFSQLHGGLSKLPPSLSQPISPAQTHLSCAPCAFLPADGRAIREGAG
jgi:hypothetical protein